GGGRGDRRGGRGRALLREPALAVPALADAGLPRALALGRAAHRRERARGRRLVPPRRDADALPRQRQHRAVADPRLPAPRARGRASSNLMAAEKPAPPAPATSVGPPRARGSRAGSRGALARGSPRRGRRPRAAAATAPPPPRASGGARAPRGARARSAPRPRGARAG